MHRHSFPILATLFAATVLIAVSCQKEESFDKPTVNIKTADWHTIPAAGDIIEVNDILLEFPAGSFDKEAKVAITPVKPGTVKDASGRELSEFYQVVLPSSGTKQPITVGIRYSGDADMVSVCVETPHWFRNQNLFDKASTLLPTVTDDGLACAVISPMDDAGDEQPCFIIGVVDSSLSKVPKTKADNESLYFTLDWCVSGKDKEKYEPYRAAILGLIRSELPNMLANFQLFGIDIPTDVIPYKVKVMGDRWGEHDSSRYKKTWGVVNLNVKYFYDMMQSEPFDPVLYGQLQQTLIHETFHWIHDVMYDGRTAANTAISGSKGDEWAMLSEAIATWIEHYTGDKSISINCVNSFPTFLDSFYPERERGAGSVTFQEAGYGMGFFINWLSLKTSNKSILEILEWQREKTGWGITSGLGFSPSLKDDYNDFLAAHKLTFFDDKVYSDFIWQILKGKTDKRFTFDLKGFAAQQIGLKDAKRVLKGTVPNFGMRPIWFQINTNYRTECKDSPEMGVAIYQNGENLRTTACIVDPETGFQPVGSAEKDKPVYIPGKYLTDENWKGLVTERIRQNTEPAMINSEVEIHFVPVLKSVRFESGNAYDWLAADDVMVKADGYGRYIVESRPSTYSKLSFVLTRSGNRFGAVSNIVYENFVDKTKVTVNSMSLSSHDPKTATNDGRAFWTGGKGTIMEIYF